MPPWRPETGHAFFGVQEEHYIGWLPVVSRGAVDAVLTVDGRTERRCGTGYHDHNWGNIAPRKVLDHWYWARARVGDYTVVTLMFASHHKYDNAPLPAVMVAKDGAILASAVGAERVDFSSSNVVNHAETGVPVARRLEYEIAHGDSKFRVKFDHRRDVFMLDFGTAGAYLRFTGDVNIEHHTPRWRVDRIGRSPLGTVLLRRPRRSGIRHPAQSAYRPPGLSLRQLYAAQGRPAAETRHTVRPWLLNTPCFGSSTASASPRGTVIRSRRTCRT